MPCGGKFEECTQCVVVSSADASVFLIIIAIIICFHIWNVAVSCEAFLLPGSPFERPFLIQDIFEL